jgi:phosphohistidine phosphatase
MRLYLLRHAKSSWDDASLADHDRPLAARGRRAAALVAAHVRDEGIRPALVLCSSARRARETLDPVVAAIGGVLDVRVEDGLYGAGADELFARVREVGEGVAPVLLVGHNPGLHDLAAGLAGDGEEEAMARLLAKFPTGALATLDAPATTWSGLDWGTAYLAGLVVPRDL